MCVTVKLNYLKKSFYHSWFVNGREINSNRSFHMEVALTDRHWHEHANFVQGFLTSFRKFCRRLSYLFPISSMHVVYSVISYTPKLRTCMPVRTPVKL